MLGWIFFSSDKFRLFNKPFLTEFLYDSKSIVVLSLKLKRNFACDFFGGLKIAIYGGLSYGGLKVAILAN